MRRRGNVVVLCVCLSFLLWWPIRTLTREPLSRHSSFLDICFPTRKLLSQHSYSGRVNLPQRAFPNAWTPLPMCDFQRTKFLKLFQYVNAFSQHVKSFFSTCETLRCTMACMYKHSSKNKGCMGCQICTLANSADEQQRQSLAIVILIVRVTAETSQYACAIFRITHNKY